MSWDARNDWQKSMYRVWDVLSVREKVKGHTKFITTRFGNVLGSNGSVIPRLKNRLRMEVLSQ